MKKIILLMIVSIWALSFISCNNHRGCYTIDFGDTLEFVEYNNGVTNILMTYPPDDTILEYNQQDFHYLSKKYNYRNVEHIIKDLNDKFHIIYYKTKRIQYDIYGPYNKRMKNMSLEDRIELMTILDTVYRDMMLEERLWHVKKINGFTGEITIDYKWFNCN